MAPVLYILAKAAEDPALAKMLSDTDAAVVTTHTERAAATSSTAIDDLRRALVAATSEKTTTTTYLEPVEVDMDEEMAKRRRQRALDALPAVPEWQQSRPFMYVMLCVPHLCRLVPGYHNPEAAPTQTLTASRPDRRGSDFPSIERAAQSAVRDK